MSAMQALFNCFVVGMCSKIFGWAGFLGSLSGQVLYWFILN